MRLAAFFALCLLLPGCLLTTQPVFNAQNSMAAAESPAFMRIVELWETEISLDTSPRELGSQGARVIELDGVVIVEDLSGGLPNHYALVPMGRRVAVCVVHHKEIETIGARHKVQLKVDRDQISDPTFPTLITADGTGQEMFNFVMDAFKEGLLICQSGSDTVRGFH